MSTKADNERVVRASTSDQLLQTKLHTPCSSLSLVERRRLVQRLDRRGNGRLTVLTAPAGYGKTTLLGEWATQRAPHVAWLSLDRGDNDAKRFLGHLIAAIRKLHAHVGGSLLPSLQSPDFTDAISILTVLLNELAALDEPFTLILTRIARAVDHRNLAT